MGTIKRKHFLLRNTNIFFDEIQNFFLTFFRLNLIYLTLILHGIGTLMPWNMFVTAKEVRVSEKKSCARKNCLAKTSIDITRLCNTVIPKIEETLQGFFAPHIAQKKKSSIRDEATKWAEKYSVLFCVPKIGENNALAEYLMYPEYIVVETNQLKLLIS